MEALALQLEHSCEFQTNPASIFFFLNHVSGQQKART